MGSICSGWKLGKLCTMTHYLRALVFVVAGLPLLAQSPATPPPPPRIVSPEVHSDASVTFRFRDPNAKEVLLALEGTKRVPMQKDEQGVWSLTTAALSPDIYGYTFVADGVSLMDPVNHLMKPNLLNNSSAVHIPGPSLPWEINDVPRG